MPLEFTYPACQKALSAPFAAAGVSGRCKFCNARIIAPAVSGQPATLDPAGSPTPIGATTVPNGPPAPGYAPEPSSGYAPINDPMVPPSVMANPKVAKAFMSSGVPAVADFWKRFIGFGIDMIFISLISVGIQMALQDKGVTPASAGLAAFHLAELGLLAFMPGKAIALIELAAIILYGAVFEGSPLQATPGKWILGMKVAGTMGQHVSFPQALWRNTCKWIIVNIVAFAPIFRIFPYAIFFYAMRDDLTQTLHDMMAGSVVAERYY